MARLIETYDMMKKHWWKILGVLLVLYSLIVGMLVPLKPGILRMTPNKAQAGETITAQIVGYNTRYTQSEVPVRAWLKLDSAHTLAARRVEVLDDRHLRAEFDLPRLLPSPKKVVEFSLILDDSKDGASVYPEAVFVVQDSIDAAAGARLWVNTPIQELHHRTGMAFPFLNILNETIRNTYYHVPFWFAMFIILTAAVVMSFQYLRTFDPDYDRKASALTSVGLLFGLIGILTGAIWAKNTWGAYWSFDVKQNTTAIALLIYAAYFVLRDSFDDPEKKARISGVYNIFAFATLVPLLYVIPKLADSLHPGSGGNIPIGSLDLDRTMRLVFYPAIVGWTLIGVWIAQLSLRVKRLKDYLWDQD